VGDSSRVASPMRPATSPTTAIRTNAPMIIRRIQRGGRGAILLDHEFVKLDQRASSCKRATGSSPRCLLSIGLSIGLLRQNLGHEAQSRASPSPWIEMGGSVTDPQGCPQELSREGRFRCDGSAPGAFL
jgi:hypothetical protein